MPTNPYFNNYFNTNEQKLYDDLVVESIKMYGIDMYYITRQASNIDNILNEDDVTIFDAAYLVEFYVKTNEGFAGQGDFLSQFGMQIKDQSVFSVAKTSFAQYVLANKPEILRPREGDLLYFPLNNKFFDITHVEHESVFYQNGNIKVFDLSCELLEFSNERFQTGVTMIDNYVAPIKTDNVNNLEDLYDKNPLAKNIFFENEKDLIIDDSEFDPFKEIITFPTNQ